MATSSEEHIIKLTQQISGPAAIADSALAKLEAQLARAQAKVADMSAQKLDTSGMDQYVKMLEGKIRKRQQLLASGQVQPEAPKKGPDAAIVSAEESHVKALGKKKAMLEMLNGEQVNYLNAVKGMGGPVGSLAGKFEDFAAMAGRAGGWMQGAALGAAGLLIAAITKLVQIAVAATVTFLALSVALTAYALHAADAARSARLLESAAAGSALKGDELSMVISDIASRVPIARAQVAEFGRQLELAGISGRRMQLALEAIAMIESVVPGAGAKIESLAERFQKLKRAVLTKADLEGTGLALQDVAAQLAKTMNITQAAALAMLQNGTASIDKVLDAMNKAIEQKFGKTIAMQMASLAVQWQKFKENIAGLFAGLDLEAFLTALKSITDLFSQNTVTGRVLKETMKLIFQPMFDQIARGAPYARAFIIGLAIALLKLYIELKPLGRAIKEAFDKMDKAKTMEMMVGLASIAVKLLGFGFRVLGGAILIATDLMRIFGASSESSGKRAGRMLDLLLAIFEPVGTILRALGLDAGVSLGDGLAAGIDKITGMVMGLVNGLGENIETALRNAIGWHSPATLGVDAIGAIGDGMQAGAPDASDKAGNAVGGLVNPSAVKSAAKGAKAGGGASRIVYIENFHGSRENLSELRAFLRGEGEFALLSGG